MPNLQRVTNFTHQGEPGFKLSYEAAGLSAKAVAGRLTGRMVSKYPLKANRIEVLSVSEADSSGVVNEFVIDIFVPNSGIQNNAGVNAIKDLVASV